MHPTLKGLIPLLKRRLQNLVVELDQARGRYQRDPEPDQKQHPK
jgi:hypothetical protein